MKATYVCLCLCFTSIVVIGQSSLKPAYIVTLKGDTIHGEMEYKLFQSDQSFCTLKTQGKDVKYNVDEIKGFRFANDKMMKSGIVKGKFVEQLIDGKLKLYRLNNIFYVQKNNEDVILLDNSKTTFQKEENGLVKTYEKKNSQWLGVLKVLTNDAPGLKVNIDKLNYNYHSLTKLVKAYNEAVGSSSTEYLAQRKSNPAFGLMVGAHFGKVGVQANNVVDYILSKDYRGPRYDIGIFYYIDFPKISESVGFQGELHYYDSKQSETTATPSYVSTIYTSNAFKFRGISVPLSVKYKIMQSPFKMNLQVGIEYDHVFKSQYESEFKRVYDNSSSLAGMVSVEQKSGEMPLVGSNVGYLAGIHVEKKIGRQYIGLMIRYSRFTNLKVGNDRLDHAASGIYTGATYSF